MDDPSSTNDNHPKQQSLSGDLNNSTMIAELRQYISNLNELQGEITNLNCSFQEMSQNQNNSQENKKIIELTQKNLSISQKFIELYSFLESLTEKLEESSKESSTNSKPDTLQLNEKYQLSLDQIQQLKNTIDERDIQISQLRDSLSNASAQSSNSSQKEIDQLKSELSKKDETINKLNEKISAIKESQDEIVSKQKRRIAELEFAQRKLKVENDKIKKQIEKSQTSMDEMIKIRTAQNSATEIEKAKREVRTKDTRIDSLEIDLNQKDEMIQQLQEKCKLLNEKDQTIRELKEQLSSQTPTMTDDPKLKQRIGELESKLKQQSDYESLKTKVQQQEQRISQLETENSKTNDQNQIIDLKQKIQAHKSEISVRTKQVQELKRSLAELQNKNDGLRKDLKSKSLQNDELNSTIDQLRVQNIELRDSQSSDLLALNEELKIKGNEIESQGHRIEELEIELHQFQLIKEKLIHAEQRNGVLSRVCCRIFNKESVDLLTETEINTNADLLQDIINEKSKEIVKLRQELSAERESSSRIKNLVRTFHNDESETAMVYTFDNYQIQLKQLEQLKENQKQTIESQQKEIKQLKQEKGQLENTTQSQLDEIAKLTDEINKLQNEKIQNDKGPFPSLTNGSVNTRQIQSTFTSTNFPMPEIDQSTPNRNENDEQPEEDMKNRRFSFSNNPRFDRFLNYSASGHTSKTPQAKKRTVSFNKPELLEISSTELEQAAESSNEKGQSTSTEQSRSLPSSDMKQKSATIELEDNPDDVIQLLDVILTHYEIQFICESVSNNEKERVQKLKSKIAAKIKEYQEQHNKNLQIVDSLHDSQNQSKIKALNSLIDGLNLINYNRLSAIEKLVTLTGSPESDDILESMELDKYNQGDIVTTLFSFIYQKLADIFHIEQKDNLPEINTTKSLYFIAVKYATLLTKLQNIEANYDANENKNKLLITNLTKKYKKAKHFMLETKMNDKSTIDSLVAFCPPIGQIDRVKKRTATLPDVVSLFLSEFPSLVIKTVNQSYLGMMEKMIQKMNVLANKVDGMHKKVTCEVEKSHGMNYVSKHQMYQTFNTALNTLFPPSAKATPTISEVRLNRLLGKITLSLQIALYTVSNTKVSKNDSIYNYAIALKRYLASSTLNSNSLLPDPDEANSISCLQ